MGDYLFSCIWSCWDNEPLFPPFTKGAERARFYLQSTHVDKMWTEDLTGQLGYVLFVCLFFQELESGQSDAGSGTLLECVNLISSPSTFPAMRLVL